MGEGDQADRGGIFFSHRTMMYGFQTTLHARPTVVHGGGTWTFRGTVLEKLHVPPQAYEAGFPVSFEEAQEGLGRLPRMFLEPDGSLLWTSPRGTPTWQVEGNLFDRDGRLLLVDLRGNCPAEEFDRLLTSLGWPEAVVMFQLMYEAVFLGEADFRRYALAAGMST